MEEPKIIINIERRFCGCPLDDIFGNHNMRWWFDSSFKMMIIWCQACGKELHYPYETLQGQLCFLDPTVPVSAAPILKSNKRTAETKKEPKLAAVIELFPEKK